MRVHHMPGHGPPFDEREYRSRLQRTKDRMAEAGIDVLFCSDPSNMNYLSGYDGWSFYVHQGLIVSREHDQPVWVGRDMDAKGARVTTWLDDDHVRAYGDDHVHSPVDKHPMDFVAGVVEDMGLADRTLGVEMDAYYYTARTHQRLQDNLPEADFVDADLLVNWVRCVKSDAELEYMEQAAKISEAAMQAGIDTIGEGVTEADAAAEIYHTLVDGVEAFGGDYPSIVPLMPSGDNTGTPHLTWTDREFQQGDPVIIELAGCRHRYHSPLARTTYVGGAPDDVQETADIVVEGLNAVLDTAEPGVTAETVERAWRDVISSYGIEKAERIGYSMGLGYPPDWGEHTASLRPKDETVLEENMTFHVIPGLWFDDYGVEISESFKVTSNGCETLADFPRQLFTS